MNKKIGMKINMSMGYIVLDIEIDENNNLTAQFYGDRDREVYDNKSGEEELWVDTDSQHLGGFEFKISDNGSDVFDSNHELKK